MENRNIYRADVLSDPIHKVQRRKLGFWGCTAKVTWE